MRPISLVQTIAIALSAQGCYAGFTEQTVGRANRPRPSIASAVGRPAADPVADAFGMGKPSMQLPNQIPMHKSIRTRQSFAERLEPERGRIVFAGIDAAILFLCKVVEIEVKEYTDCIPRTEPKALVTQPKPPIIHVNPRK